MPCVGRRSYRDVPSRASILRPFENSSRLEDHHVTTRDARHPRPTVCTRQSRLRSVRRRPPRAPPDRALESRARRRPTTAREEGLGGQVSEYRGRGIHTCVGLHHRPDEDGIAEHQRLRPVSVHQPDAGRAEDLPRSPRAPAGRRPAQRFELAPYDDLADRLLLRSALPLQHHELVTRRDAANADLRKSAVPCRGLVHGRRRDLAQPHRALIAGLISVLGGFRSTDGRGVFPRRLLVGDLRDRPGGATIVLYSFHEQQHQPAWGDTDQRHAQHDVQRRAALAADHGRVRSA